MPTANHASRLLLDPWRGRQRLWIVFLFYWLPSDWNVSLADCMWEDYQNL